MQQVVRNHFNFSILSLFFQAVLIKVLLFFSEVFSSTLFFHQQNVASLGVVFRFDQKMWKVCVCVGGVTLATRTNIFGD